MTDAQHILDIIPEKSETRLILSEFPSVIRLFLKAVAIAPLKKNNRVSKRNPAWPRIVLHHHTPNPDRIASYRHVCGFDPTHTGELPAAFFQTLFIGLLGKFITSSFFPFNPLGLIQTSQSFELKRKVHPNEALDLSCALNRIRETGKGFQTDFLLQVHTGNELVWEGISGYLSKVKTSRKTKKKVPDDTLLKERETIVVPGNIGRQYAGVSGDFNPHHLYPLPARLFGFRSTIAHGMWSLARVSASLDKTFNTTEGARIEAAFKLPVFIPATTVLGYESRTDENSHKTVVRFELRDKSKGLPHLKGRLLCK